MRRTGLSADYVGSLARGKMPERNRSAGTTRQRRARRQIRFAQMNQERSGEAQCQSGG